MLNVSSKIGKSSRAKATFQHSSRAEEARPIFIYICVYSAHTVFWIRRADLTKCVNYLSSRGVIMFTNDRAACIRELYGTVSLCLSHLMAQRFRQVIQLLARSPALANHCNTDVTTIASREGPWPDKEVGDDVRGGQLQEGVVEDADPFWEADIHVQSWFNEVSNGDQ